MQSFLARLALSAIASAGLCVLNAQEVQWTTNYYSVYGTNLAMVHRSIQQSRPWKNDPKAYGSTEWRVDWRFDLQPAESGCRVQRFTTKTSINITLPRWTPPTNAPASIREIWGRYIKALEQHEVGHGQIALAAAGEVRSKVTALVNQGTCDALKRTVNNLCSQTVVDYRKKDEDYDRRTDHGATQGARLPERGFRNRFHAE